MMSRGNLTVAGLNIGSAKTTVCIGAYDSLSQVEIHSVAMVKTRGVERGVITNLGEVAGCIEEVVKKAELKFHGSPRSKTQARRKNIKINSLYATISGEHVIGNNTKGMLSLSNQPVEITRQDTRRTIDTAKSLATSIDREILHSLPQQFTVDAGRGIKDPLGIYGMRLGVNLHIISCGVSFMSTLIKAVNRAGLDVDGVAFSGWATSLVTLNEQEKQAGIILLELGAGTINILFFSEGTLQYTSVIGHGGDEITIEIAQRFGIDFRQAEQLKMQYQSRSGNYKRSDDCEDKIIIKKSSSAYESITRKDLTKIVDEKLQKLLKAVKKDLELAGIVRRANNGIVVCGGMSFMDGIIEKLEVSLKLPVRLGIMHGFVSNLPGLGNIFYATSIGLVMNALAGRGKDYRSNIMGKGFLSQTIAKIKNVYEEYF